MGQICLKDKEISRFRYNKEIPLKIWVDLRENASCPDILNQGNLDTSSVNALSNVIRFWLRKQNKKEYQPSRLYMYYYAKIENYNKDGVRLIHVIEAIKKYGICSEQDWVYNELKINDKPNDNIIKEYSSNIKFYSIKNKIKYLKQALSLGFPIVFLMSVFSDFENVDKTGIVSLPKNKNVKKLIYVSMYGYRDSSSRFICMNSFGKEWGERGFFYIPFKYVKKYCFDFWVIRFE